MKPLVSTGSIIGSLLIAAMVVPTAPASAQVAHHGVRAGPNGVTVRSGVHGENGGAHRTVRVNDNGVTVRSGAHNSNGYVGRTVHYDRNNPNWWHGHPGFNGYHGVRHGYYYAPGYGYYHAHGYYGRAWVVGVTVPVAFRSYVVVNPAFYGLAVAPVGQSWIYVNNNIVLINRSSGVIIRTVPRVW